MRFAVALPWWGYALVFASALGLAVYTYAGARLVPARRALLTALRAAALLLLVTAVLRPVRVLPPSSAHGRRGRWRPALGRSLEDAATA